MTRRSVTCRHRSLLARLLGPLFLIVGASVLFNPKAFRDIAAEVTRSVTLVYLFGFLDFAAGLAIVLTHNVWLMSWRVLVTLIGWFLLIRGAARVLIPETIMGYAAKMIPQQATDTGGGRRQRHHRPRPLLNFGYVA